MIETDDPLDSERFSYVISKDDAVHIQHQGRTIKHLKGREAGKFLDRIEYADARQAQLLMAKATGHFKHGNERSGIKSPR